MSDPERPESPPASASLQAAVPERYRVDGTVIVPRGAHIPFANEPGKHAPTSYQPPQGDATDGLSHGPPLIRERIVASASPTDAILTEIRRAPAERMVIESRAASGGMGTIDVAVDRALDRRIAVKTLHTHLRSSEGAVRMFLREARLTGLLDHPHIVPIYDIGERDDDHLYFAMKLVEGQTLSDVISAIPRGPLDTTTLYALLDVLTKVCDALAFAHSRGVLHCDIKPANIMVGEFGQVYLMDWGIARLVGAEASPASAANPFATPAVGSATDNAIIGTPCYMSPEQARGDRGKLDARSDVFLLGSVLYEVLTRRPPYASSDRTETLSLAVNGAFPAPRKVAKDAGVPPELERIVLRAMAKRPEDRYASAIALREDLLRFMRGGDDFPRHTFAAGETIIREGERGEAAYIIVAGSCAIQKELPTGTETLQVIGPGAVFGEMAILTEGTRTASVVALEPTTVMVMTGTILEQEMQALKPWMATLLKSLAARFRDVDTKHRATAVVTPSPARLANLVLMLATTWGEPSADPNVRSIKWTDLNAELEAQLGVPPLAFVAIATRYDIQLDRESDRVTIRDVRALTATLTRELGR